MEITKVYTENGNVRFVQINDEGLEYPIPVECLHKPLILDGLLDSGWELFSLPYNLQKGDTTFDSLPKVEKGFNEFSIDEQQDMMDMNNNLYTEVELRAKITDRAPIAYFTFRRSGNIIKTREEFLEFLMELDSGRISNKDYRAYLPLNSFVAEEALFTIPEYFDTENRYFKNVIEQQRKLSIPQFQALTDYLVDQKLLVEDYTPKALVDAYMEWGIPGMKGRFLDKRIFDNQYILGTSARYDIAEAPYVYDRDIALIDHNGKIEYPKGKEHYTVDLNHNLRQSLVQDLASRSLNVKGGARVVAPINIKQRIPNEVTRFEGEYTATFNESYILIEDQYSMREIIPMFKISIDGSLEGQLSGDKLDFLHNVKTSDAVTMKKYLSALVTEVSRRKTVPTTASTRNALRCVSVSPSAGIRYLLNHSEAEDLLLYDDPRAGKESMVDRQEAIVSARSYIYGKTDAESMPPQVREIVDMYLAGTLNVDAIATGHEADANSNTDHILKVFLAAYNFLGLSYEDLYNKVAEIDIDTEEFKLEGNGFILSTPLSRRDNTLLAYRADIRDLTIKQATESASLHYVTTAFREIGVNDREGGKQRHVAVETLTFNKFSSKARKVYSMLLSFLSDEISMQVPASQLNMQLQMLDVYAARAVFQFHLEGRFVLPKSMGGKELRHDWIKSEISSLIQTRFESIIGLTEEMVKADGKFQAMIVNASLIDDLVIPHKNNTIVERALWYYWTPVAPQDPLRNTLFEKGHIPRPDWEGASRMYQWVEPDASDYSSRLAILGYGPTKLAMLNNPVSMGAYMAHCKDWKDNFNSANKPASPPPYRYVVMPHIYAEELEAYYSKVESTPNENGETLKWEVGPKREITHEIILEEFPRYKEFYNPAIENEEALNRVPAERFKGLSATDIYFLGSKEKVEKALDFPGDRLHYYYGDTKFKYLNASGTLSTLSLEELPMLVDKGYAVTNIYGRKYLFRDLRGDVYSVEL